jgi:hypothetical protein
VIVPVSVAVAPDLAIHHRPITSDLLDDFGVAQASVTTPHDRDALIQTEPMAAPTRLWHITEVDQTAAPALQ